MERRDIAGLRPERLVEILPRCRDILLPEINDTFQVIDEGTAWLLLIECANRGERFVVFLASNQAQNQHEVGPWLLPIHRRCCFEVSDGMLGVA